MKLIFGKILYHVKYYHSEFLDEYDSYLICPNHSRIFDVFYVFPLKYDADLCAMAKKELFKHWYFRIVAKYYHVIPIDRQGINVKSIMSALKAFKENKKAKMIIFPEGKVIKEEKEIGTVFRRGATSIAKDVGIPIVPVYISRRPKLFQTVEVIYGEPYFVEKETTGNVAKQLIEKIYELPKRKEG